MVNHSAVAINQSEQRSDQRTQLTRTLWLWLSSPALLVAIGIIVFLLLLCAIVIPQLPGAIADDPAAATRWLLTVSDEYGPLGTILRTLGLFDVLHNPVLQLLLALITLVLLVHLANLVAILWRFQQIAQNWQQAVAAVGAPAPLPATQPLYRWRQVVDQEPDDPRLAREHRPVHGRAAARRAVKPGGPRSPAGLVHDGDRHPTPR